MAVTTANLIVLFFFSAAIDYLLLADYIIAVWEIAAEAYAIICYSIWFRQLYSEARPDAKQNE